MSSLYVKIFNRRSEENRNGSAENRCFQNMNQLKTVISYNFHLQIFTYYLLKGLEIYAKMKFNGLCKNCVSYSTYMPSNILKIT